MIARMKEEMVSVREKVETLRHAMKKERNGNRLRQAQQDKLAEMLRKGKEETLKLSVLKSLTPASVSAEA